MSDKDNKKILEVGDEDFQKIRQELKREGKKDKIVIKSLKIVNYPVKKLQQRYNVRYKFNKKHLVMDLVVAGLALFLVGINVFYWLGGFHYFINKVDVNITVQSEMIVSGERQVFEIEYANNNAYAISLSQLSLQLPDHFVMEEISKTEYDRSNNTLYIGELAPGANGRLIVTGTYFGDVINHDLLVATVSYYKTNKKGVRLWGQFRKIEKYTLQATSSLIMTDIEFPEKVVSGQEITVPIKVANNSKINIDEIKITPELSEAFTVVAGGNNYIDGSWYWYQLGPGEELIQNVVLKVVTGVDSIELSFQGLIKYDGDYLVQNNYQERKEVFDPGIVVTHALDREVIAAGDRVNFTVYVNNQKDYTIEDVEIKIMLSGSYWSLSSTKPMVSKIEGNQLIFNQDNFAELALIQPREQKQITFSVGTKAFVSGVTEPELSSKLLTAFDVENIRVQIGGDQRQVRVSSNLQVRAFARYYTAGGEQLGRGPLPPEVGQETKYWVFLQLLNDINTMDNVSLSATVPVNVNWTNRSSVPVGNAVDFNASTRRITWSISKVSVDPKNIGVAFELGIVPIVAQQGQAAILLRDIVVSGRDSFTGERISRTIGSVTTNLVADEKVSFEAGIVK